MQILVRGKLTYSTKLALKRLSDRGHNLHYAGDAPGPGSAEASLYDWAVDGVTAFHRNDADRRQPLSTALREIVAA